MKKSNYNIFINIDSNRWAIYNTLRGTLVVVDQDLKEALDNDMLDEVPKDIVNVLHKNGFLVDDDLDEFLVYKHQFLKARYGNNDVLQVVIVPTYACNLSCIYCFQGGGLDTKTMDIKSAKLLVRALKDYLQRTNYNNLILDFYGGEPLIAKNVIKFILENLQEVCDELGINMHVTMTTNGTLITENTIKEIFSRYNFRYVQITVDGNRNIHNLRRPYKNGNGTYDDIMRGLELLSKASINIIVRMNIDFNNKEEENWIEFINELKKIDNGNIVVSVARTEAESPESKHYAPYCIPEEDAYRILGEIEDNISNFMTVNTVIPQPFELCFLMRDNAFAIDPYLDIYKCPDALLQEEFKIGHIDKSGKIKFNSNFYKIFERDPTKMEKCASCPLLPICHGGCALMAKYRNGNHLLPYCSREPLVLINEYVASILSRRRD